MPMTTLPHHRARSSPADATNREIGGSIRDSQLCHAWHQVIVHHARSLRRALWGPCACILRLPRLASATPSGAVDFDGDGQNDRFAVDRADTSLLSGWRSASNTVHTIRSRGALEAGVVGDLDGDRRPELVARDRTSRIHVWTCKHRGFRPYRWPQINPATTVQRSSHAIDSSDTDTPGAIADVSFVPCALLPSWSPRAFRVKAFVAHALPADRVRVPPLAQPVAPRPPPTLVLS